MTGLVFFSEGTDPKHKSIPQLTMAVLLVELHYCQLSLLCCPSQYYTLPMLTLKIRGLESMSVPDRHSVVLVAAIGDVSVSN